MYYEYVEEFTDKDGIIEKGTGCFQREMETLKSQKKFKNWKLTSQHQKFKKPWARLLDTEKENSSDLEDTSTWIIQPKPQRGAQLSPTRGGPGTYGRQHVMWQMWN